LVAHHNLPPALSLNNKAVWHKSCDCQGLCQAGDLSEAYNEVHCSRLASAQGDRRGLRIHASAPLRSADRTLGILNLAAQDWSSFTPRALALLTNAGTQIGIALERARLFDMLRARRIQEQASLLEFSNQLLSRRGPEDLMHYLVTQVRELLEADACALVLPTPDPGWLAFRSAVGWNRDPVELGRRIPADDRSGPGRVMHSQQPLLVQDLQTSDPTDWTPEWLHEEDFRGHAVVPLIVEGRSIGTLIINDRKPRRLDEEDLRYLRVMANQAAIALEKARLNAEETERQRMEDELAFALQIQLSLLPEGCPSFTGWECAATYRPALKVSGDFYDFFELPDDPGRWGLVIADVSDKGVPAALFMAMCRTTLRSTALSGRLPAQALARANQLILKDSRAELFLTAFYASLEPATGEFSYAVAGHNRPLLLRDAAGDLVELEAKGAVLGMFEDVELEGREMQIEPGDLLVLYTDGVTEAMDEDLNPFGEARLREVVKGLRGRGAQEALSTVVDQVEDFTRGTPQSDDLTMVILRRLTEG
jgi:sigma-B regulation protein RsbU (phosphoserine phosphatase)